MHTKQSILEALSKFARQRPGLEFGNYGDAASYRAELRQITRDLTEFRALLNSVYARESITAQDLLAASRDAYSGRLTIRDDGTIDYCTGQYWPTEYRKACCAVLARALWRDNGRHMPAPQGKLTRTHGEHDNIEGITPGDWLRRQARREFGRGIASRWFN